MFSICHGYHNLYVGRKICHVERFQISIKSLTNLWRFYQIMPFFVHICVENKPKSAFMEKIDKYDVLIDCFVTKASMELNFMCRKLGQISKSQIWNVSISLLCYRNISLGKPS